MTAETPHPGARPYSLAEIVDLFLGDLAHVETAELAAQIDSPLLGKLFERILEKRRAARLNAEATTPPHLH